MSSNPIAVGERFILARPTIEVAAAEIRLTSGLGSAGEDLALSLRESLRTTGLPFRVMNPAARQEVSLSMSPSGGQAVQGTSARGWTFNDEAAQPQVTLLPDVLLVQTSSYTHFSETLRPILVAALQWLEETGQVHLRTRAGLRYINRLVDESATTAQAWQGRIEDWLLGPIVAGPWGSRVEQAHQQLQLRNEDSTNSALRHGPFRDAAARNSFSYLLDIDVFDSSTEPFNALTTLELLTRLNYTAASTFRRTLTSTFLEQLGIEVEPAESGEEDR
ncbi:TIGR04255 family protein [Nocardioides acrostichi]|uniref:TIGR04255 family protein n=1 Tax=Nocardioides acrostichi TaxID=2784339 RepID=A0A930UZX5_9ACTN|nr:TIGR04255 family protein [Nocardioides acrostichi]MBF4163978.1 TIGR04255 family protein [Nocardioides acrostichi]